MCSIYSYWHLDLGMVLFIIALCLGYLYLINFKLRKKSLYFLGGIILILLCVTSPLYFIGKNYLFSAHMISHVAILLIAAPLLVAGIPEDNRLKKYSSLGSKRKIKFPVICWFTGIGVMWFWHIPAVFDKANSMHGMGLMYVELLSLLIGGIIFSWPVINPDKQKRISPITGVLYLSTACIFCSLLGLMITFAPPGIYTTYLNIPDSYGYLPLIRNEWKISAASDQQIAGLIMWVPCCFVYLAASMILLIKWFEGKEKSTASSEKNGIPISKSPSLNF